MLASGAAGSPISADSGFSASNIAVSGQDADFGFAVGMSGQNLLFRALNDGDGFGPAILEFGSTNPNGATFEYDGFTGAGEGDGGIFNGGVFARNLDGITGTAGNDVLTVAGFVEMALSGAAGNDVLTGGDGAVEFRGGAGADQLTGGVSLYDRADYSDSASRVGVNLTTGAGLGGDAHGDQLAGIEDLVGTDAALGDFLTGDDQPNWFWGLSGPDQINGMTGFDAVWYDTSADRVSVNLATGAGLGGDAHGDQFTDIEDIFGSHSALADFLTGDAGANRIEGLAGPDQINGMGGEDTAEYWYSSSRINVNLSTGQGLGGDAHGDQLTNIENLVGTRAALGDFLTGNAGVNTIEGLWGNDFIAGLGGADQLFGDEGVDTADYSASASRISVNLGTGAGLGGDAHGDDLFDIENVIGTNAAQTDFLTGDGAANRIEGLGGDDLLSGLGGADALLGGAGVDTADYSASIDRISVNLATGAGLGGDAHGDSLGSVENLVGTQSSLADFLTGSGFANRLEGLGGADIIAGLAGADVLIGGAGVDTADYSASTDRISVNLGTGAGLGGDAHGDSLSGFENLLGTHAALTDFLTGNGIANRINGLSGSDQLAGAGGNDTFVFSTTLGAGNVDAVADFDAATDGFEIDNAVFTGLAAGALAASAFVIGAAATDAAHRIVFNQGAGTLFFDADGNGAGAQVQFASVTAGIAMSNADFFVI